MQQITIIVMYCSNKETCIQRIIESSLLIKIRSYVYQISDTIHTTSDKSSIVENAIYPYFSIIHHFSTESRF